MPRSSQNLFSGHLRTKLSLSQLIERQTQEEKSVNKVSDEHLTARAPKIGHKNITLTRRNVGVIILLLFESETQPPFPLYPFYPQIFFPLGIFSPLSSAIGAFQGDSNLYFFLGTERRAREEFQDPTSFHSIFFSLRGSEFFQAPHFH